LCRYGRRTGTIIEVGDCCLVWLAERGFDRRSRLLSAGRGDRLRSVTPESRASSPTEGAFAKAQREITCRHQLSRFSQGGGEQPMTLAPEAV
jgi:hypothetical protein